jgi:tRNA (mo5U34)-methyltransferase
MHDEVDALTWYHTVDLGDGRTTPGIYDIRPYLRAYGLPRNLSGKTVLDVGAASGFFSFELESRGAAVTATDLPAWAAHDFGPLFQPELTGRNAEQYLHAPFELAHRLRGSGVQRRLLNIYDLSPDNVGTFDLVFCGSVLVHLTDPVRALWRLRSVTRGAAIISTVIHPVSSPDPLVVFAGHHRGDGWWLPNRTAFEAMIKSAGFTGWEWFSEFRMDYRNGEPGPYHAVVRAWVSPERPAMLADADSYQFQPLNILPAREPDPELDALRARLSLHESTKYARLIRWLRPYREQLRVWFGR